MSTMSGGDNAQKTTTSEVAIVTALNDVVPSRSRVFLRKTEDAKFEQVPFTTLIRSRIVCDGGPLLLDASVADIFDVSMKKDVVLVAPKNGYDGQRILVCFRQGEKPVAVSWDKPFILSNGFSVSKTKNTSTYVTLFYDAPLGKWLYVESFSASNS